MRQRIVVAPDKFKGSLSALDVARAIERGLAHVVGDRFTIDVVPMADGGEGTVAAFAEGGARSVRRIVRGPLGTPVEATFARDGDVAIVEMASASGLALLATADYAPRDASTYGTGELISAALDDGATRIVVGIGGSATNDGGAGMLAALGMRFIDARGAALAPGGAALRDLAAIDVRGLDPRLASIAIDVAADVDNPLCGPSGASAIFGPQMGASPRDVAELDAALERYADVAAAMLHRDVRDEPGAGAAGGLGFALSAFLGARLRPGVEIVAELRGLARALDGAAWCLTGEGRIDTQTLRGKTVAGVARIARRYDVPVIAIAGSLDAAAEDALFASGVTCVPICEAPMSLARAMDDASALVERAAARIARLRFGTSDRSAASS
ncbi:MAG: glycerate kinase [Vulcanimicrobiaceae bacterium]